MMFSIRNILKKVIVNFCFYHLDLLSVFLVSFCMFSKKVQKISSSIVLSSLCSDFGNAFSQGGSLFYFQKSFKETVKEFCKRFGFNDVSYPEYIEKELISSEDFFKKNKKFLFFISSDFLARKNIFFKLAEAFHKKEQQLLVKLQDDVKKTKEFTFAFDFKSGKKGLVVFSAVNYLSDVENYLKGVEDYIQNSFTTNGLNIAKDLCKEYINCINSLCEKPVLGCEHDIIKIAENTFSNCKKYFAEDELYKIFELINGNINPLLGKNAETFFKNNSKNLNNFITKFSEKYYRALFTNLKIFEFSMRFILKLIDDTENVFLKFADDSTSNSFSSLRTQVIEPLIDIAEFFKNFIKKEKHSNEEKHCLSLCRVVCKALLDIVNIYNEHSRNGVPCICQDSEIYKNFFYIENDKNICFCREARVCKGFISKTKTIYAFAEKLKKYIEDKNFSTGNFDCQKLGQAVNGLKLYVQRPNFSGGQENLHSYA